MQLPLVLNPGYLSFDELQWWARADSAGFFAMPWVSWTDLHALQYRPLTFNLWLILARALAAHAVAMHAVFVLLGTLNALLLAACLRRLRVRPLTADIAAIAFVLSPCAAYTHGWTGTLADLLVAQSGLLGAQLLLRDPAAPARRRDAVALAVLAALALLAKESAIVLPALWLAVAATRSRSPRLLAARIAPAALVVLIYLAARMPTLWFIGSGNHGYAWQLANIPRRLAEYALFPWLPPLFEIAPILDKGAARLLLAAACCGAVLFALLRTNWRHAAIWALLIVAALAPVLVLSRSFDHYAYLATLAGIGVVAWAWQDCSLGARWLILIAGGIACLHGAQVMLRMREIGGIEQRFHADLVAALQARSGPLRIVPARPSDDWMLERWVDYVPSYRGVAVAGRVTIGSGPTDAPVLTMQPDGSLLRAQDRSHPGP